MGADHDFAVSIENYIKTIWHLEQRFGLAVSNRDLSDNLQVTRPSVSQMISRLEALGLVKRETSARGYRLSARGRAKALKLLRAHRLVEMFLQKSLGLGGVFLHQEAERLEHAVSEKLISEMDRFLGYPAVDLAGAPIPRGKKGAVEIPEAFCDQRNAKSLLSKALPGEYRIFRIHDDSSKLLEYLDIKGVSVGARIAVTLVNSKKIKFQVGEQSLSLSARDGASVEVDPV